MEHTLKQKGKLMRRWLSVCKHYGKRFGPGNSKNTISDSIKKMDL